MKTPRILIVYTGGTFGMVPAARRGERLAVPDLSPAVLRRSFQARVPELAEIASCDVDVVMNCDSAHIGPAEWARIAARIRSKWQRYDGVVVLHGTDTLAYTASALSFLLRPCLKPVILTGAQRPLAALRSDARRNLVSAVEIASSGPAEVVRRVCVYFDDQLYQGNRVHKRSARDYHAFDSPHLEPLASVGTDIRYRRSGRAKFFGPALEPCFSSRVSLIQVTPGFPAGVYSRHLLPELDGVVLNVFASGTAPTHDSEFIDFLKAARAAGKPIVITSEGDAAADPATYEAGRVLLRHGCIWAGAMTSECALVKMSLLLGQEAGARGFARRWKVQYAEEG